MDATVIIATYGDPKWITVAQERAIPSTQGQCVSVLHYHGESLHQARNFAASQVDTEWLCFLDADDELAPGYFEAMDKATGDLRAPAVSWVENGVATEPRCLTERNIKNWNPCVVGTLIRKSMFERVEGFWDERAYEDWSLFRRAWLLKAKIEHVPDAIYIAHVRPESRNSTVIDAATLCQEIRISHREWMRKKKR
jgi:glycosyltransferase involved in cell wall biosynthesis